MSKDKKMKGWLKGLIAAVMIVVLGGLVYYGANGEMFQGRTKLNLSSRTSKTQTVQKVNKVVTQPIAVDGIQESLLKEVATEPKLGETVQVQPITSDKLVSTAAMNDLKDALEWKYSFSMPALYDLTVNENDTTLLKVRVDAPATEPLDVYELSFYEDGGGLADYSLYVSGVKITDQFTTETVYLSSVGKNVKKIKFQLSSAVRVAMGSSKNFELRADVVSTDSGFVSLLLDSISTDRGQMMNTSYDFGSFQRMIQGAM